MCPSTRVDVSSFRLKSVVLDFHTDEYTQNTWASNIKRGGFVWNKMNIQETNNMFNDIDRFWPTKTVKWELFHK